MVDEAAYLLKLFYVWTKSHAAIIHSFQGAEKYTSDD